MSLVCVACGTPIDAANQHDRALGFDFLPSFRKERIGAFATAPRRASAGDLEAARIEKEGGIDLTLGRVREYSNR
jgi:hypothetical protein